MGQNTSTTKQPQANITPAQQRPAAQPIDINAALLLAVKTGDLSGTRRLVSQGADLSFEDAHPRGYHATALHWAARNDQAAIAHFLLGVGAPLEKTVHDGSTPLHFAVSLGKGKTKALTVLLRAGANTAAQDQWGNTPLHDAASRNNIAAARVLIRFGADLHAQNHKNQTPLDFASQHQHADWIAEIKTYAQTQQAIIPTLRGGMGAAQAGILNQPPAIMPLAKDSLPACDIIDHAQLEPLKAALESGELLANQKLADGALPLLHYALLTSAPEPMIQAIIQRLSPDDLNQFSTHGTALQIAIAQGQLSIVDQLLTQGASAHACAPDRQGHFSRPFEKAKDLYEKDQSTQD
jgi:ankyrin repeat protein